MLTFFSTQNIVPFLNSVSICKRKHIIIQQHGNTMNHIYQTSLYTNPHCTKPQISPQPLLEKLHEPALFPHFNQIEMPLTHITPVIQTATSIYPQMLTDPVVNCHPEQPSHFLICTAPLYPECLALNFDSIERPNIHCLLCHSFLLFTCQCMKNFKI